MSQQKSDFWQPKTVIYRDEDPYTNLKKNLGILDFDVGYGNEFPMFALAISILRIVQVQIKRKIIDITKRPDLELPKLNVYRIQKVWRGTCYIGQQHDPFNPAKIIDRPKFHYDYPKPPEMVPVPHRVDSLPSDRNKKIDRIIQWNNWLKRLWDNYEVLTLPAFRRMKPIGSIDQDSWGKKLRESVTLKDGLDKVTYTTAINEGLFYHKLSDKNVPKFKPHQMTSKKLLTDKVSSDYFFTMIEIQKDWYLENWYEIDGGFQLLIRFGEGDEDEDYETKPKSKMFGKVD